MFLYIGTPRLISLDAAWAFPLAHLNPPRQTTKGPRIGTTFPLKKFFGWEDARSGSHGSVAPTVATCGCDPLCLVRGLLIVKARPRTNCA